MDKLSNNQLDTLNNEIHRLCLKLSGVKPNDWLTRSDLIDIVFYLKVFQKQVRREQEKRIKLQLSK